MTGPLEVKGNPQYGNPVYLGISFAVLIFILLITRYAKGLMSNVAVLLGIVFGFLLSWMMNEVNLSGLHDASWFAIVTPMSFGMPIFDPVSILTMTAVLMKWHTEFGHLNRGDMLTSEQHRCSNEKKKF